MGCVKIFIFFKFALCGLRDFSLCLSVESIHYYNLWREKLLIIWFCLSKFISEGVFPLELRSTLKWNSPFVIRFVCLFGSMWLHFRHIPNDGFWKWCVEKLNLMNPICLFFSFFLKQLEEFLFSPAGVL